MAETVELKIHKTFAGHTDGDVLTLPAYGGLPTSNYWRRRLRDAAVDGCCDLVKAPKRAAKAKADPAGGTE